MRVWLAVVALAGCVSSSAVPCPDGRICPKGTVCVELVTVADKRCVLPDQLEACAGVDNGSTCNGMDGTCDDGVCLPAACGNGYPDPAHDNVLAEACDDGNQISGDHCSGDCSSTEICGNGVVDPIDYEACDDGNLIDHDGCDSTCTSEAVAWQFTLGPPTGRSHTAMAFDPIHGELVMFGGSDASGALGDTWLWNGTSWLAATLPDGPSPRFGHAMAFDADRGRVIMFGGQVSAGPSAQGGYVSETWDWDGRRWHPIPTLTAPPPRGDHRMVYDPIRHRVMMFGGTQPRTGDVNTNNVPALADLWEWDGKNATWMSLAPSPSPGPRFGQSMAYDPRRGRIVMFGGNNGNYDPEGSPFLSDLWELDSAAAWQPIVATGPSARADAAMAFDPVTNRMIVAGGAGPAILTDQWAWDGTAWSDVTNPAVTWKQHAMATDAYRGLLVGFGGVDQYDVTLADTRQWDGSYLATLATTLERPSVDQGVAYDPTRGLAYAVDYAKETGNEETFAFDGRDWHLVKGTTPPTRNPQFYAHTYAFDIKRGKVIMLASDFTGAGVVTSSWVFGGTGAWTQTSTTPTTRVDMRMVYDPDHDQVVAFGGHVDRQTPDSFDDTWIWDGATWTQAQPLTHPSARSGATLAYDPLHHRTILVGGQDTTQRFDDTWVWDGANWAPLTFSGAAPQRPVPMVSPAITWNPARRSLVMFGGDEQGGKTYELVEGTGWQPIAFASAQPIGRAGTSLIPTQHGLALYGGIVGINVLGGTDLYATDVSMLSWLGDHDQEACVDGMDTDGDGLEGCADDDCWAICRPLCPPGISCPPTAPHCGDGTCSAVESPRSCPADCAAGPTVCGDLQCAPGELCPGDCDH